MNSSDSAEELIKIYLDGVGFVLKITGEGSKNLIAFLMAMSKEKGQTKGKTRLTNMLKSGKELKIFPIDAKDLKKFSQEAKKYGVLYCVLANKKNDKIDGMVDIMVRQEDAAKVNRIAERFNFAKVDTATIKKELEEEKNGKSKDEQMIEELLAPQEEIEEFPSNDKSVEENQLESSYENKKKNENNMLYNNGKKSVKKELQEIQKELQEQEKSEKLEEKMQERKSEKQVITNVKENQKVQEEQIDKDKEIQKPKHLKEPKHLDTENYNRRRKKKRRNKNKVKGRSK